MGNCQSRKGKNKPNMSKEMVQRLSMRTDDLAKQKPVVVDVVLPTQILKVNDAKGKDGVRRAEEVKAGSKIFESGVVRWNQEEKKLANIDEVEEPATDEKLNALDKEVTRYIKRLQLSMPSLFGDDKARSISVGTAFKLGQTVLTLNDQESNTYLKVGLPEGNTLDMAKADVSRRQSLS